MQVYFTDVFNVEEEKLDEYGAYNISLINDMSLSSTQLKAWYMFPEQKQNWLGYSKIFCDNRFEIRRFNTSRLRANANVCKLLY